ncbi:hypothetical protein [Tateyamaria sp.]|uniref:hypothetical protein n=1 Tax=Tateyamaria sp. TaxID=1929288 RepID=UPI003B219C0E
MSRGARVTRPEGPGIVARRMRLAASGLLVVVLLGGCAALSGAGREGGSSSGAGAAGAIVRPARLTEAQACAIGYDIAREIHAHISLRRTVIVTPRRETACERHALTYLRRAGFRIDETGQGGVTFDIRVDRTGADTVTAIATIGETLRISRSYAPVRTGVRALSAVSIQSLAPDSYAFRETPS